MSLIAISSPCSQLWPFLFVVSVCLVYLELIFTCSYVVSVFVCECMEERMRCQMRGQSVCVCVWLKCVWVDEHSPLKCQLRYLTLAVTQLKVIRSHSKSKFLNILYCYRSIKE